MYQQISEKLFRVELDGVVTDIPMNYAIGEMLFIKSVTSGIAVDAAGAMEEIDPVTAISLFRPLSEILLTKYGTRGEILELGNSFPLSSSEIADLFEIATLALKDFIATFTQREKNLEQVKVSQESSEEKSQTTLAKTKKK